ncbi:hypothetical protein D9757_012885 [Collybiopsis confluens]|uniref:Uncharacterized protein n=1 Tax=Collybiopsis confluens TaxID=2823264 RepID=A0A8H5G8C3_9AGAR|nr:hypothetical protein D9757_012885 [Collybiopsis confluens]
MVAVVKGASLTRCAVLGLSSDPARRLIFNHALSLCVLLVPSPSVPMYDYDLEEAVSATQLHTLGGYLSAPTASSCLNNLFISLRALMPSSPTRARRIPDDHNGTLLCSSELSSCNFDVFIPGSRAQGAPPMHYPVSGFDEIHTRDGLREGDFGTGCSTRVNDEDGFYAPGFVIACKMHRFSVFDLGLLWQKRVLRVLRTWFCPCIQNA